MTGPPASEPPPTTVDGAAVVWRWVPRPVGVSRAGRDRRHTHPGRTRRVAPTFTEDEYAAIVAAAVRWGLTPSGFCGVTALAAASDHAPGAMLGTVVHLEREAMAVQQAELADLRIAVVRVGTNLNQAVAVLHSSGDAPVWLRHVADRCAHVLAAVDDAASRLHGRSP